MPNHLGDSVDLDGVDKRGGAMMTIASRTRPMPGEVENGDAVLCRQEGDVTWFGIVDGLGHGGQAAVASRTAIDHLAGLDVDSDLGDAVHSTHLALRGTRGVAALICTYRNNTIHACGVGNVELRREGTSLFVRSTPGVLGGVLARPPMVTSAAMPARARLVLFSDGISPRFSFDALRGTPDEIADEVMANFVRPNDDASVLVAEVGRTSGGR